MAASGVRVDLHELLGLREAVQRLAHLAQRRSAGALAGAQRSPFRGRGMEYAESRPYAPGDDARHIDWRLSARSGRTHTKLFQPERERITAVVYDRAEAMAFGTRVCFKSVQAARLAALMLWLAAREGHRLAAAGCGLPPQWVAPAAGRRGVLRALDALVRWQPQPALRSDPAQGNPAQGVALTLESLRRVLRPGSQILLLLDPRSVDAAVAAAVARLHAHHDLAACLLLDPIERAPPPPGCYGISDGRRRGRVHLASLAARQGWAAHFAAQQGAALECLRRAGAQVAAIATDEDPVTCLGALLAGRAGRAERGA